MMDLNQLCPEFLLCLSTQGEEVREWPCCFVVLSDLIFPSWQLLVVVVGSLQAAVAQDNETTCLLPAAGNQS